jgi:FMN phosphatase YigB (HAD superfamily)
MAALIWDLGDTLVTRPPGGQDLRPLATYPEVALRPGVREVLDQLRDRGHQHAILSNTAASDSAAVRQLLLRLNIADRFQIVHATQSELDPSRPGKPDPEVFHRLLAEWRMPVRDAIMVGNTWDHDVLGAQAAGITAIFLTNPQVSVRHDTTTPLRAPPWVLPVWDVADVPQAVALLTTIARQSDLA